MISSEIIYTPIWGPFQYKDIILQVQYSEAFL